MMIFWRDETTANSEQAQGTKTQPIAKLQLPKHNADRLGDELASDQRLSGLS